jgi:hypothetical protein
VRPPIRKITLCHKRTQTLEVPLRAVLRHLFHGDRLGPCKRKKFGWRHEDRDDHDRWHAARRGYDD